MQQEASLCAAYNQKSVERNLVKELLELTTGRIELIITGRNPHEFPLGLSLIISTFHLLTFPYISLCFFIFFYFLISLYIYWYLIFYPLPCRQC